jgi:hypothetical protein
VDFEDFGNAKKDWLEGFLELPNGIPCPDPSDSPNECVASTSYHPDYLWLPRNLTAAIKYTVAVHLRLRLRLWFSLPFSGS